MKIGVVKISLTCLSLLFSFGLAETSLRLAKVPAAESRPPRSLFWSIPIFRTGQNGLVSFVKHSKVREVAVYDGKIEYDQIYQTNDFGSPDDVDYGPTFVRDSAKRNVVFVGDSFGAGSGGFEWIPEIRRHLENPDRVNIYNFSVPGAGLYHHVKALENPEIGFAITDIVILAISDDLERPYWIPEVQKGTVYFKFIDLNTGALLKELPVATGIAVDQSSQEILQLVRNATKPKPWIVRLLRRSHLLILLKNLLEDARAQKKPALAFSQLKRIRETFPQAHIYFIHIPEKSETLKHSYRLQLKNEIESMGIEYHPALLDTEWRIEMFHPHDGHLNSLGYENLERYVGRTIFKSDFHLTLGESRAALP